MDLFIFGLFPEKFRVFNLLVSHEPNLLPFILQEQERALYEQLDQEEDPKTTFLKLRKAGEEATNFAPIELRDHYNSLNRTGTWQKY